MAVDFSKLKIEDGTSGEEMIERFPDVYRGIGEIIDTYLDMHDDDKIVLTSWIMAAAYKDAFNTMPELFINASKASGKTRLLKLLESILPETIMTAGMSESALFRISEVKRGIFVDEAERMGSKEKLALKDVIGVAYKKGGKVLRVEGDKVKKVREFIVYNPIALANVWGLESVLEDRCITIILEKTDKQAIITMPELFDLDPRIKAIRAFFECTFVQVQAVLGEGVVQQMYGLFLGIYNTYTLTLHTLRYTKDEILAFLRQVQELQLEGRQFELWLPLFIITYTTDRAIYARVLALAVERSKGKAEDDLSTDRDTSIAIAIFVWLEGKEPVMTTKEFIQSYVFQEGGDTEKWLTPEWLARFIKRAGVMISKRRLGKGNEYRISIAKLKNYLSVRGALQDAEEIKPSGQIVIPGAITKVPDIARARDLHTVGICPECGQSAPLFEIGKEWRCRACLTRNKEEIE